MAPDDDAGRIQFGTVFTVTAEMVARRDWQALRAAAMQLMQNNTLFEHAGCWTLHFTAGDPTPRSVMDDAACRGYMLGLEKEIPFLYVLLDPQNSLPLLMACHLGQRAAGKAGAADVSAATDYVCDRGYRAYALARTLGVPHAARVAANFLQQFALPDDLVDTICRQYKTAYAAQYAQLN